MKTTLRDMLLALIPLILALMAATLLETLLAPPLLRIVSSQANLIIFLGIVASLISGVSLAARRNAQRRAARDLTALRREQDQAHRRFLRRLDHELKNPLTAMRLALANLSVAASQADRDHLVTDVSRQADRLTRLVADLRKLAELEERPLERLPVNLNELLQEVIDAAGAHPAHTGRTLRLHVSSVPWPLPAAVGDRDLLSLAFYNLIDNALKFSRPQDTVEVRALEDGRWLTVEVADTGPGIPADDLPRIFDELYRGANARGYEGSGLGLALVQRIVTLHGGDVSVRSRPGQGTVFTVRLPFS